MSASEHVAVITGATGGLGRVVARRLAQEGARLALLAGDPGKLADLTSSLNLPTERIHTLAVDLTDPASARFAFESVRDRLGHPDLLLHFVGGWSGGKAVTDVDPADVSRMLDQHLWSTLYIVQAFVPAMVAQKWGRIVVISSPTASRPAALRVPYAVGKAAEEALMLTLSEELRETGVTANSIVVSTIDVKHERASARKPGTPAWTTPEEIASMIVYLCSEEAGMVNGARIPMYGSY